MNNNENNSANKDDHNNLVETGEGKQKTSNYNSMYKMTNSYFCFECGAIMTTKEDKKQHEKFELDKKTEDMEEKH